MVLVTITQDVPILKHSIMIQKRILTMVRVLIIYMVVRIQKQSIIVQPQTQMTVVVITTQDVPILKHSIMIQKRTLMMAHVFQ